MALVPMEFDDDLISEQKSAITFPTVAAGYVGDIDIDITKTGYTPIGIIGFNIGGAVMSVAQATLLSTSSARIRVVNSTSYAQTPTVANVLILYKKS